MDASFPPRYLTTDEKKAAEAAFDGCPFDPKWSPAARSVYDGIRNALGTPSPSAEQPATDQTELNEVPSDQPAEAETALLVPSGLDPVASQPPIMTREEAIQAGFLIDVTPIAQSVGLPLPVCISKPLWDFGITASHSLPDNQYEARVRDVLVALRLRLATARVTSPWIEFPALLSLPPESAPQLCSLHAFAHGDQTTPSALIVLLSNEVSAIIRPTNN